MSDSTGGSGGSGGSGDGTGISDVSVTINPDPGFPLGFDTIDAVEELGRPFCYTINLSSGTVKGDLTAMIGSSATIAFKLPGSGKRYVNGIITRAVYVGLIDANYRYRLEMRPWIWLLSRVQTCCIFQQKTVWDIITGVFRAAGFTDFEDKRQNQAGDQMLDYCVQYDETTLDFVSRLMEKYGLYYYFTHTSSQHTLVMADDPASHTALATALPYHVKGSEMTSADDYVSGWSADLELQPGAVSFRDYNFTTPSADLTAKALQATSTTYGKMEVYNYPGPYDTAAEGQKLATVRMQTFSANAQIVRGTTNARNLVLGSKFTLKGAEDTSQNREYLVIAATTQIIASRGTSVSAGSVLDSYSCKFAAIPGSTVFRTLQRTPWPVMRGPQTAKVVGAAGDEITTDQYGRIKVSFFWDRNSPQNENSSCWIRVAQAWAGVSWGSIFIPRIGQEVVVDFLDGNPDRPIITGSVYNATDTVPYALPDNKTRSTVKTNSSPGGGGFNEFRFEDKAGSEEVFFQAQKDYNKVVLNNETVKITQDTTTTVSQGNRSITVSQGNNSITVSQGNNSITVSAGNDSLTVSQGNHSITVSAGSSTISAGQSITLQVGANSIVVNTEGVTINGTQIGLTASAQLSANGGGQMTLQAGMISIN
jgi:type VI secretion system secreted protein VgrG